MNMYIYIYTYIFTYIYIFIHIYTYIHIMYISIYLHVCEYAFNFRSCQWPEKYTHDHKAMGLMEFLEAHMFWLTSRFSDSFDCDYDIYIYTEWYVYIYIHIYIYKHIYCTYIIYIHTYVLFFDLRLNRKCNACIDHWTSGISHEVCDKARVHSGGCRQPE